MKTRQLPVNSHICPEDGVFDLNDYFPDNFPARLNYGGDTYEKNENLNFGNAKYHAPLKEDEEHQDNNDDEPPKYVEGTNYGDDDDNLDEHSKNSGVHEETSEIIGVGE